MNVRLRRALDTMDLDDPQTTAARRSVIQQKRLLRDIYRDWYAAIAEALPPGDAPILELGSGAGFMRTHIDRVIASDILAVPELDLVLDACRIPLANGSLRAIVMTNVLHHVQDVSAFLGEAARVVRPGGAIVMIEPWVTPWSRFVYGWLHHEPFDPNAADWNISGEGPLSGANSALPWILFERDRVLLERSFPAWKITSIDSGMPLRYVLSGGPCWPGLVPAWSSDAWRWLEMRLRPFGNTIGMFARIVLRRSGAQQ